MDTWGPIIIAIFGVLFGGGGVLAYLKLRPDNAKTNAEATAKLAEAKETDAKTDNLEIQQAQAIIGMWQGLYQQLEKRVAVVECENADLRRQLVEQGTAKDAKIAEQDQRIEDLEREVEDLRDLIRSLGKEPPPRRKRSE